MIKRLFFFSQVLKQRQLTHLLAIYLLLFQLLPIYAIGEQPFVVCISFDGSIAVEPQHKINPSNKSEPSCCQSHHQKTANSPQQPDANDTTHEHNGGCIDISLLDDDFSHNPVNAYLIPTSRISYIVSYGANNHLSGNPHLSISSSPSRTSSIAPQYITDLSSIRLLN